MNSNPIVHNRSKHIEIDVHFVREKVVAGILQLRYIPTNAQLRYIPTVTGLARGTVGS